MGITESRFADSCSDNTNYICCSQLRKAKSDSAGTNKTIETAKGKFRGDRQKSSKQDNKNKSSKPTLHEKINQNYTSVVSSPSLEKSEMLVPIPTGGKIETPRRDLPQYSSSSIQGSATIGRINRKKGHRTGGEVPWTKSEIHNLLRSVKDTTSVLHVKQLDLGLVQVAL